MNTVMNSRTTANQQQRNPCVSFHTLVQEMHTELKEPTPLLPCRVTYQGRRVGMNISELAPLFETSTEFEA
jgi:hypothetical protein